MADPRFEGFGPNAFKYLAALDFHQSREWFAENRAMYEAELREPLLALCGEAAAILHARGLDMRFEPKKGVFRINRDVRFSKDKRPYNRHVSAILSRDGTKSCFGVLYVHVGLDERMFAGGFWALPKEELALFRRSVVEHPRRYRSMVDELGGNGLTLDTDDALKRLPRGWDDPGDADLAAALRLKGFTISEPWAQQAARDRTLLDRFVEFGERTRPLIEWGCGILD